MSKYRDDSQFSRQASIRGGLLCLALLASWACGDDPQVEIDGAPASDASSGDAPTSDGNPTDAGPTDAGSPDAGGPPGPECGTPDSVCIVFPPPTTVTDDDAMTIRGKADTTTAIAALRVAGVDAQTTDGYANWQATVSLSVGANDIIVEREDVTGAIQPLAAQVPVMRSPLLTGNFSAFVFDIANDRAFAFDRDRKWIVELQLSTGVQRDVSGPFVAINLPGLAFDSAGNRLLATESLPDALSSVDLITGVRTVLADATTGSGPALAEPYRVSHDPAGNRALVSILGPGAPDAVFAVDLATLERTILSDATHGSGPMFSGPGDLVLDPANQRVLLGDLSDETIWSIDLVTGARAELSGPTVGAGYPLYRPQAMVLDAPADRLFVVDVSYDYGSALRVIDLDTGDRTVLSYRFAGPPFTPPPAMPEIGVGSGLYSTLAIAWDPALDGVLIGSRSRHRIVDVDITTGDRTPLWGLNADNPVTPSLSSVIAPSQDVALLAGGAQVVSLDLVTGRLELVADNYRGAGQDFLLLHSLAAVGTTGRVVVADWEDVGKYDTEWALLDVEIATGNRVRLPVGIPGSCLGQLPSVTYHGGSLYGLSRCASDVCSQRGVYSYDFATGSVTSVSRTDTCTGDVVGTGPEFWHGMASLAIDAARGRALVLHPWDVLAVDLATGDRSIISDASHPGPALMQATSLEIEPPGDRALVVDRGVDALLAIDLDTGERTLVSGSGLGRGPEFAYPTSIALLGDTRLALVTDGELGVMVVDLVTSERALLRR